PQRMDGMARRTPVRFQFTVKANREMTHEISEGEGVFDRFREALRPLIDHGKLGCVLAQFPWGFKNTKENRHHLELLSERLEGIDTVVEFRNAGWEEDETFTLLSRLGLGYCCVDEPRMKDLLSPRVEVTSRLGYIRFHGRNYETWWGKDRESWERYNYLYSEGELAGWMPKVEDVAEGSDRTYVIFNNHYKGQAPTNARMFERMLRGALGDRLYNTGWEAPGSGRLFE
ncbi:MAG: DUF72 domain-containing protein, partial [Actinomycetia bacterium]|nr:DUF72 domain-containing protein [Actinomycetes bacterium]